MSKRFRCHWDEGYVGGPSTETHSFSYFSTDLGFTKDDREAIDALDIGEVFWTGGPVETLTITRIGE